MLVISGTLELVRIRLDTLTRLSELLSRLVKRLQRFCYLGHGQVARITDLRLQLLNLRVQVTLRVQRDRVSHLLDIGLQGRRLVVHKLLLEVATVVYEVLSLLLHLLSRHVRHLTSVVDGAATNGLQVTMLAELNYLLATLRF